MIRLVIIINPKGEYFMKTKSDNIFSSKTLNYFLQLAETMNYTQAAQLLGITQPALTQQIRTYCWSTSILFSWKKITFIGCWENHVAYDT